MSLSLLKERFLAAMPVIGPHAGIEGELMLAGKKPLTWLSVERDDFDWPDPIPEVAEEAASRMKEHKYRLLLDQKVKEGKLLSADVIYQTPTCPGHSFIMRHYCLPGYEKDLARVVEFNEKAFNGRWEEVNLDKDMGVYLGYRKRDILLFNLINRYDRFLPERVVDAVYRLNRRTQASYQAQLLKP